ncbi:MAG TPA: MOSC domain-containing protein [Arcobacter sp.]|nr:MOSC domain-containing protein [Arcobacter sp.]
MKNIIAQVLSVQIGKIKIIKDESMKEKKWETGSFKKPVSSQIDVTTMGIKGDEISDLIHHGGIHKAVFANSYLNYPTWSKFLNKKNLEFGSLGENITFSNIKEEDVCIGDIHQIGEVILEVSQPRQPCWKLSKMHNIDMFKENIYETNRTGWYYRVLEEGTISKDDSVVLVKRLESAISIFHANEILKEPSKYEKKAKQLIDLNVLSQAFKNSLIKRYNNGK